MATLTGNTIASTYTGLLSVTGAVGADTVEAVTDGAGTSTSLSLSQQRATITLGSGAADDFIVDGTTFVVEGDNNKVGIGTASPAQKLTVEVDATDGGTGNDGQLALRGATNTNLRLMMGMDTSSEYGFISPMKLGTSWNNLSLCYNGGNVGIGDNAPATKLDVNGDIQIQGANAMILNHTTGAASDTYINSPSDNVMGFRTGGTQRFALNNNSVISLSNNDSGSSNTLLGDSCADSLDAGSNFNVFIGKSVATGSLDDASDNVAIGFESMKAIIQGDDNVALGMRTLLDLEDGNNNTAIGDSVLRACVDASDNTAVGAYAMDATTTGNNNVAMGKNALGNTADVDRCVAIGSAALSQSNITSNADGAIGIGYFALGNLTTGAYNTAIGYQAMMGHTTGHSNIAIGRDAMGDTDAGSTCADSDDNIAIGYQCMGGAWNNAAKSEYNVAMGNYALDAQLNGANANTCIGYSSGSAIIGGSNSVLVGFHAGSSISSGSNNVCIGYQAGTDTVAISTGDNNVVIGRNAHTSANSAANQIVIGQDVAGNADNSFCFGAASTDSAIAFGATSISAPSDVRMKRNIKDSEAGLSFINDLRPVTFEWKKEKDIPEELNSHIANSEKVYKNDKVNHGFIAQEVKECIDSHPEIKNGFDMWSKDDSDGRQRVAENALVPVLVKAVQELTAKVEELETKLNNKES